MLIISILRSDLVADGVDFFERHVSEANLQLIILYTGAGSLYLVHMASAGKLLCLLEKGMPISDRGSHDVKATFTRIQRRECGLEWRD